MRAKIAGLLAAALTLGTLAVAHADPFVTYTATGSAGNWTLDFTLTNNLGGTNALYLFGVELPTVNVADSPTGWTIYGTYYNNYQYTGQGTNISYNNIWGAYGGDLPTGQSLSGFKAVTTDLAVPTTINWFAYARGGTYTDKHIYLDTNPGFEGVATLQPVPEASTFVSLTVMAATGCLFGRRRRR